MTGRSLLDRSGEPVAEETISQLAEGLNGSLIMSDDPAYEKARRNWNALIDKYPGAILRCRGTADVVAGVNFARQNNVLAAVRGGGHNVGGRALCDDGLVIDLSGMRSVFVDPSAHTVRVQGGAKLGDVDRETHVHGLAVPLGVVSRTGVAGLTLGGGVGWLVRRYGPSCDNVLEMEVVTAGGEVRTANETENADLFWAMRGGGGNFGIATSFLYRAYPVSTVLGGVVIYPRSAAGEVLRFVRDYMKTAPNELNAYGAIMSTPDGVPASAVIVCWSGEDLDEGTKAIAPLRKLAEPLMDAIDAMPFPAMQAFLDEPHLKPSRNYWKSTYVRDLPDQAIDALVKQADGMTSPQSALVLECHGGATKRRPADFNAFAQRDADFLVGIMPQWTDPADDESNVAWARSTAEVMQPFSTGGTLVTYISAGEEDVVRGAFGSNYERLREIKSIYDPENFFSQNQNVKPLT